MKFRCRRRKNLAVDAMIRVRVIDLRSVQKIPRFFCAAGPAPCAAPAPLVLFRSSGSRHAPPTASRWSPLGLREPAALRLRSGGVSLRVLRSPDGLLAGLGTLRFPRRLRSHLPPRFACARSAAAVFFAGSGSPFRSAFAASRAFRSRFAASGAGALRRYIKSS